MSISPEAIQSLQSQISNRAARSLRGHIPLDAHAMCAASVIPNAGPEANDDDVTLRIFLIAIWHDASKSFAATRKFGPARLFANENAVNGVCDSMVDEIKGKLLGTR